MRACWGSRPVVSRSKHARGPSCHGPPAATTPLATAPFATVPFAGLGAWAPVEEVPGTDPRGAGAGRVTVFEDLGVSEDAGAAPGLDAPGPLDPDPCDAAPVDPLRGTSMVSGTGSKSEGCSGAGSERPAAPGAAGGSGASKRAGWAASSEWFGEDMAPRYWV